MLTTRFAPKGSSFKKALKNLRPGDAIKAHDLEGDFVVEDAEKTFVFIAGEIGITPFRAILLDLDYNRKPVNLQLLYANRDNDFVYREELEILRNRQPKFGIDYVVSPKRIDEESIPRLVPDIERPFFYVSGPEPMVESMDETLKKLAFPREGLRTISFPVTNGHSAKEPEAGHDEHSEIADNLESELLLATTQQ
jgi:ferredoxin-NADP reductase